jgi:hypothetical protein
MNRPAKSRMAELSRGFVLSVVGVAASMLLVSCRVAEEPVSPDGIFLETEVATFNIFRYADSADRVPQSQHVVLALQAALKRTGTRGRITQEQIKRHLGEPSGVQIDGAEIRLLYRISRKGGAEKLLALVWEHGVFLITEPVWTVE